MAFEFQCPCGKLLSAEDDWVGKRAQCPSCEAVLRIPSPGLPDEGKGNSADTPAANRRRTSGANASSGRPRRGARGARSGGDHPSNQPKPHRRPEPQVTEPREAAGSSAAAKHRQKIAIGVAALVLLGVGAYLLYVQGEPSLPGDTPAIGASMAESAAESTVSADDVQRLTREADQIFARKESSSTPWDNSEGAFDDVAAGADEADEASVTADDLPAASAVIEAESGETVAAMEESEIAQDIIETEVIVEEASAEEAADEADDIAGAAEAVMEPVEVVASVVGEEDTGAEVAEAVAEEVSAPSEPSDESVKVVMAAADPVADEDAWEAEPVVAEVQPVSMVDREAMVVPAVVSSVTVMDVPGEPADVEATLASVREELVSSEGSVTAAAGLAGTDTGPTGLPGDSAIERWLDSVLQAEGHQRPVSAARRVMGGVRNPDDEQLIVFLDASRRGITAWGRNRLNARLLDSLVSNADDLRYWRDVAEKIAYERGGDAARRVMHIIAFPRKSLAEQDGQARIHYRPGQVQTWSQIAQGFGPASETEIWDMPEAQRLGLANTVYWWSDVGISADREGRITHVLLRGPVIQ